MDQDSIRPLNLETLHLQISDDDDLPVGADFRTVMKEAKKINIASKLGSSLDLGVCVLVLKQG